MNRQLLIHLIAALLGSSLLAQDAPPPPPPPGAPGAPGTEPRKDDNQRGGPPRNPNDPLRPPGRPEGRPPRGPDGFEPDGPLGGGPRDGQRRAPRDPRGGPPEGERLPGFGNGGPGEFGQPPFPGGERPGQSERPMKATPYIGVVTSPVSPAMGAQLGLNEGFGLVVDDVLPDSPAQAAGVQKYDVLKLVNDQQLVDPGQLAGLLRGLGKDADVSITLIRKAQEQKVTAKVGEKMLPAQRPGAFFLQRRLGGYGLSMPQREPGDDPRGRGPGAGPDSGRRFLERPPGNRNGPGPEAPPPPQPSQPPREAAPNGPADLFREARPGGAPQLRLPQADGVSTFQTNRARIAMKDNDGEIEIVLHDGQRFLTAKNPGGEVIFKGPIDTPEQHAAVPALFRAKLEAIESQQRSHPVSFNGREGAPFPPPPAPLPEEPEVQ